MSLDIRFFSIKQTSKSKKNVVDDTSKRLSSIQSSTKLFDSHILTDCESPDESYTIYIYIPNKLSRSVDRTVTDLVSVSEMKDTIAQLTL